jgi:outer membrane protein OmpA-like peptidoglycan-associated protein
LFIGGWIEGLPRVENDLTRKAEAAATAAGFDVTATFSGQDGTLRCAAALDDAGRATVLQAVKGIKGVRVATFDASCVAPATATPATTTTAVAAPATAAPPESTVAPTTVLPTTIAPTTVAVVAAAAPATKAEFAGGRIVLTGKVASEAQKQSVFDAAAQVVAVQNIDNQIVVEPGAGTDDASVGKWATLIAAMPPNLVSGEAGIAGPSLYAKGVYLSDATKAAYEQVASTAGVTAELTGRPAATATDAAALEKELNDIVGLDPILFDPNQATITASSQGTLDRVAAVANKYVGTAIVVQGHTDSDGTTAGNQSLSEQRAAAVLDALVSRGVAAAQLSSAGFGETQPIIENGAENKDKSRRVVFAVTAN